MKPNELPATFLISNRDCGVGSANSGARLGIGKRFIATSGAAAAWIAAALRDYADDAHIFA